MFRHGEFDGEKKSEKGTVYIHAGLPSRCGRLEQWEMWALSGWSERSTTVYHVTV